MTTRGQNLKEKQGFIFPQKEVAQAGENINHILEKEGLSEKEKGLLEYLKTYLLFRQSRKTKNEKPHLQELYKKEKKLSISRKELLALHLWARGSRKNINEVLDRNETKILYERIQEKLKKPPPS